MINTFMNINDNQKHSDIDKITKLFRMLLNAGINASFEKMN